MLIQLLIKGILTGFMVSFPIGPIAVLVIQRTANRNLRAGIYSGLGIAIADSIWATIAGLSLTYIIVYLREHQLIIQIIGAIVLFLLGVHIFNSHPLKQMRESKRKTTNPSQYLATSMLIAFSNPMVLLAYIAIFASTSMVFSLDKLPTMIFFISGFFIGAMSWWIILSNIINLFRHKFNLHILWWFNKISGSIIMLLVLSSTIIVLIRGNFQI